MKISKKFKENETIENEYGFIITDSNGNQYSIEENEEGIVKIASTGTHNIIIEPVYSNVIKICTKK